MAHYCLQHIDCETPGVFEETLRAAGVSLKVIRAFAGEEVPERMGEASGLIVMGGPMGVYEQREQPFLSKEIRLIQDAVHRRLPVLGVCLGSQLLAASLGSEVRKGAKKEIGWLPVRLSEAGKKDPLLQGLPETFTPLHWHGDVFDLPAGAVSLASSDRTAHQAFRYGDSAYGFLFHVEITEPMLRQWTQAFRPELDAEHLDGAAILNAAPEHLRSLQPIAAQVAQRWAAA